MKVSKKVLAAAIGVPAALALASTATGSANAAGTASTTTASTTVYTSAMLQPVVGNHVSASGWARVKLQGDDATVTIYVKGLIPAPHAMHIHFMGEGECPDPADIGIHNGRPAMSTTDGLDDYGPIGTSLTTRGDTSPASALAITRFPQVGTFKYVRTIELTDAVAKAVRTGNAVIVVHGIDYNHNNKYDNVLGVSDLTTTLPMEATAPAICGPLTR
jgi:hypothetical protein